MRWSCWNGVAQRACDSLPGQLLLSSLRPRCLVVGPVSLQLVPPGSLQSPPLPFTRWEPVSYAHAHLAPCPLPGGQHTVPKSTWLQSREALTLGSRRGFLPFFFSERATRLGDLSSLTRDRSHAPCSGSTDSQPRAAREAHAVALQPLHPGDPDVQLFVR